MTENMTREITIIPVEGDLDLYCRYPLSFGYQSVYIEINPALWQMKADYDSEIGNAVPAFIWHGHRIRVHLRAPLPASDANDLMDHLAPLATRICDGHSETWDGRNYVGALTVDARSALYEMQMLCDEVRPSIEVWMVDDWLADCQTVQSTVTAETSDSEIDELADTFLFNARMDSVLIYDDKDAVQEYLKGYRENLRNET